MVLEICTESAESAIAAEGGGADRVELCADLLEGGITPSSGLIATVRAQVAIDIFVMIRPRGGDFCYSEQEFALMQEEIRRVRDLGVDGLILGVLDEDAAVDVARTRTLVEMAAPLPVTFHRAIDMTPDPVAALEDVIETGARRVLTSGGAPRVMEGLPVLARMVEAAGDRITVMAGGGITLKTVHTLTHATGVREVHASLRTAVPSPVRFRKEGVAMGEVRDREYVRRVTQEASVRAMREVLQRVVKESSSRADGIPAVSGAGQRASRR